MNKRGQRERTSEGLTKNMKWVKDRTSKRLRCQLNSNANYIRFDWVEFMSTEYFKVIDAINDCYKKMLEIGKCAEVFWPIGGRRPDILTAKSKKEFMREKENISRRYNRYVTTGAPRLSISIDVEIVPDPRQYANSKQPVPTEREILVKEQILEHEFTTNNLDIVKCNVCLECHIQKNVLPDHESYICKRCHTRKDPDYFMKNNLHPVWFEDNEVGRTNWTRQGKKIPILASHMNLKDSLLPNDCSFEDVQLLYHQFIYQMVTLH